MIRAVLALALLLFARAAAASTDGPQAEWALNEFGGTAAERQAFFHGNPGVLMGTTPASLLFAGWRILHGQAVSLEAGEALTLPCCNAPPGGEDASKRWLDARAAVPGVAASPAYIDTDRPGPDYTSIPNCLDGAFRNAADTLGDRAKAHGAGSPELRFWVDAQDAVFVACSKPVAKLPDLPAGAPPWLAADYRYQTAALAFYSTNFKDAAADYAAIAADPDSPWHTIAPYLRVRALLRLGLQSKAPGDLTAAHDAAAALTSGPYAGAAGRLAGMVQLRSDPAAARARLLAALGAPALTAQAASDFKDLQSLPATDAPELLDWIATIKTGAAQPPVPSDDTGSPLARAQAREKRRAASLAHARDRYAATHDIAWLLAALALMQPDDATDTAFMGEAEKVDPQSPGYLTTLYHRLRLTNGTLDPAAARALLDPVLARTDLSGTTRNLFTAERLQVATDLAELARFSLRRIVCLRDSDDCKSDAWGYSGHRDGSFDTNGDDATEGLGDDARYLIDRMAVATRVALSGQSALPAPIRLDIALTSFARAVLLHDDATADALSAPLAQLLPAMAADFAAIPKTPPGPDKLFAEYFILAKIPGLRTDLLDYTRPVGARAADFTGNWPNWVVLQRPDPSAAAPGAALYGTYDASFIDVPAGTDLGDGHRRVPDVVCEGMCGAGGFVPRLPAFLAPTAAKAAAERRLLPPPGKYGDPGTTSLARAEAFPSLEVSTTALPAPPGATYVWDVILDYAAAHPADKRSPEALHWVIHASHYGQGHNHSGKRAFTLLKARYPNSSWAKQNLYYYD